MIDKARELTEFCLRHGGRCFDGWPVKTLFEYCFFHLVDRGVFIVRDHGEIVACMFAWGTSVPAIMMRHGNHAAPFCWERSRNHEQALFLAEVISTGKTAKIARSHLVQMVRQGAAKWPDWKQKRIFTYRDKKLVELPHDVIQRMLGSWRRATSPDTAGAQASLPSAQVVTLN